MIDMIRTLKVSLGNRHRLAVGRLKKLARGAMFATILCVSFAAMSKPALGQGFFFGPGYGAGFGSGFGSGFGASPGWHGGAWGGGFGGFGVAPSRIHISIGVPPSFPFPIGVAPGHFVPPPVSRFRYDAWSGPFPDYRSQYNLRIQQEHQAMQGFSSSNAAQPIIQSHPHADWPAVTSAGVAAVSDQMIQSARRLDESLARRGEEGDVWRQYLSTELIVASDQQPLSDAQWINALRNFDAVVANGDLRWVMRSDGFAETRQWLNAWVNAKADVENRGGEMGNDGLSPPPPPSPSPATPEPPKPGRSRDADFEVLPAPQRARL